MFPCADHKNERDTWAVPKPPTDKYSREYILYNFFPCVACYFGQSKELCCGLYPRPIKNRIGTFKTFDIPVRNRNQFILMIPTPTLNIFLCYLIWEILPIMLYRGGITLAMQYTHCPSTRV